MGNQWVAIRIGPGRPRGYRLADDGWQSISMDSALLGWVREEATRTHQAATGAPSGDVYDFPPLPEDDE